MTERTYNLEIRDEGDGMLWGRVAELPGCFASGKDMNELLEAAAEAIGLYLADSESVPSPEASVDEVPNAAPADLAEHRRSRLRKRNAAEKTARQVKYSPREVEMVVEA